MKTIRTAVEEFIYPNIEFFTDMVYKGREDTEYMGIRLLDDESKFTHGALVNAAATLFAYYEKRKDERAEEVLKRLHFFIKIAASNTCKTWGKLAILRGFNALNEAGLLDKVDAEYLALVKEKTDYEDFFDKETLTVKRLPTNYLQVAMACAGYREKLGWENGGYARKIADKLSKILKETANDGWMDDELPYGRFDRYSFVIAAEFADTASDVGIEVPDIILENLKKAADAIIFMANNIGDGVCYGRSVTCHGDSTVFEVISTAFCAGLFEKDEAETALAYTLKSIEKIRDFWYDGEKKTVNMWYNGRMANTYRPIERMLETNLDIFNHLLMALKNIDRAGLADKEISYEISKPESWQIKKIDFIKTEDNAKSLIIMRKGDSLLFLPFVGLGKSWGKKAAYYAIPVMPRLLEAPTLAEYPFMLPAYFDNEGNEYRAAQYFDKVELTEIEDGAKIHAEGNLANVSGEGLEISRGRFALDFDICGYTAEMTVTVDASYKYAEMIIGANSDDVKITHFGFDSENPIDTDGDPSFSCIHSAIKNAKCLKTEKTEKLGYKIIYR